LGDQQPDNIRKQGSSSSRCRTRSYSSIL